MKTQKQLESKLTLNLIETEESKLLEMKFVNPIPYNKKVEWLEMRSELIKILNNHYNIKVKKN